MRALCKGQASAFNLTRDILGEARIVERAFGLGASALTEAVQFLNERLELEAALQANRPHPGTSMRPHGRWQQSPDVCEASKAIMPPHAFVETTANSAIFFALVAVTTRSSPLPSGKHVV
jgi:hypothetical protein